MIVPKLAGFAIALAAVFGLAAFAGAAIGPEPETATDGGAMGHGPMAAAHEGAYTVALEDATDPDALRFRVLDEDGDAVRDFDVSHTKRLHLIVVRRDLTGFRHLHPAMAEDGTWSAALPGLEPGAYRMFADFERDGERATPGADFARTGRTVVRELPAPATAALSDGGLRVTLDAGETRPGEEAELRFDVPAPVEPYLGASGHLVALREGDLEFLHVHPAGEGLTFEATFPTAGSYRLFLQFRSAGRVHTVPFTLEVR